MTHQSQPPTAERAFLTLDIPKDNENGPLVMEQVLSTLHGLNTKISVEIWSVHRQIQFAIGCFSRHKNFIIHQLESHYPGIVIRQTPDITPLSDTAITADLRLSALPIFPIRRYSQTADVINKAWIDPYLGILGALQKIQEEEVRGVQIVFAPWPPKWRKKGLDTLSIIKRVSSWWLFQRWWWLKKRFCGLVYSSWLARTLLIWLLPKKSRPISFENPDKIDHRNHTRESSLEAARSKLSQLGFQVSVRLVYAGEKAEATAALQEIASSFFQFNIAEMNGFKIAGIAYPPTATIMTQTRPLTAPMYLSIEELAGMLALPTAPTKVPQLVRTKFKIVPATSTVAAAGRLGIGQSLSQSEPLDIFIPQECLRDHIAIIGKTGSGKSTMILTLLESLLHNSGVALLDPHGDLLASTLHLVPERRLAETILIDPGDRDFPVAFNVLRSATAGREQVVAAVVDVFQKLFHDSWGPRTEYILTQAVASLVAQPDASLLCIPKLLLEARYRKECTAHLDDPMLRHFWQQEYKEMPARLRMESIAPILNKVNRFLAVPIMRNILGQRENKISLRKIMDDGQILLLHLSKGMLGEENSALLGNFFLAHLQLAALSRADIAPHKRNHFSLVVDELQHFTARSPGHVMTILSEGRKYGINMVLACQHLAQMKEVVSSVFGNIGTLIAFALGYEDAHKIALYLRDIDTDDLLNLPPHHAYLRTVHKHAVQIVSLKTLAQRTPAVDSSMPNKIREHSRARYARPRQEVEKEIARFFQPSIAMP